MNDIFKEYASSEEWNKIKTAKIQSVGGKCELCKETPNFPDIYIRHRSYENIFNEKKEDLILLCLTCNNGYRLDSCEKDVKEKPLDKNVIKNIIGIIKNLITFLQ